MSSAPPPAQRAAPPAPAPAAGGGMMSGLMGTVAQGFAFGTGSAVAREAVGSVMGSMGGGGGGGGGGQVAAEQTSQQAAPAVACQMQQQSFYDCLHHSNGDASACNDYFQALSECQSNAKFA